jgi:hypothetical protein
MSDEDELLSVMRRGWSDLTTAIETDEPTPDEDAGDGWRVKDLIAHVALWERMAVRKINGYPLPVGDELADREPWDLDRFNEVQRDLWWDVEPSAIRAELDAAHQALVRAVESAPAEKCRVGGNVWTAIDEDGAGHYHWHFAVPDRMAERWSRTDPSGVQND